jgi:hypothetical protein
VLCELRREEESVQMQVSILTKSNSPSLTDNLLVSVKSVDIRRQIPLLSEPHTNKLIFPSALTGEISISVLKKLDDEEHKIVLDRFLEQGYQQETIKLKNPEIEMEVTVEPVKNVKIPLNRQKSEIRDYLDATGIGPLVNKMLEELAVIKPDDPKSWMIDFLNTHD